MADVNVTGLMPTPVETPAKTPRKPRTEKTAEQERSKQIPVWLDEAAGKIATKLDEKDKYVYAAAMIDFESLDTETQAVKVGKAKILNAKVKAGEK